MEDILTALPWGEKTITVVAQQVRSAENRLLMAEKMAALAWIERGSPWPDAPFQKAWEDVLWAQGHDSWITATTRQGRQAWAFQIASGTLNAEVAANDAIGDAAWQLARGEAAAAEKPLRAQWLRVFNTLGVAREDLAELTIDNGQRVHAVCAFWMPRATKSEARFFPGGGTAPRGRRARRMPRRLRAKVLTPLRCFSGRAFPRWVMPATGSSLCTKLE
jgi:hypothetical protein